MVVCPNYHFRIQPIFGFMLDQYLVHGFSSFVAFEIVVILSRQKFHLNFFALFIHEIFCYSRSILETLVSLVLSQLSDVFVSKGIIFQEELQDSCKKSHANVPHSTNVNRSFETLLSVGILPQIGWHDICRQKHGFIKEV